MRRFTSFLAEESAVVKPMRVGIKHPKDLKHAEVAALIQGGKLSGTMTEKSDGMGFEVGHDDHGFYTRSSRSDKVRNAGDYTAYAKQKHGADPEGQQGEHCAEDQRPGGRAVLALGVQVEVGLRMAVHGSALK